MKLYFPGSIETDLNYLENMRKMAVLQLDYELNPSEEIEEQIKQLEGYFIGKMKPEQFRIKDGTNVIIDTEKKFEKLCASMAECGIPAARELSMYDFRIRMEYLDDKSEKLKKHGAAEL